MALQSNWYSTHCKSGVRTLHPVGGVTYAMSHRLVELSLCKTLKFGSSFLVKPHFFRLPCRSSCPTSCMFNCRETRRTSILKSFSVLQNSPSGVFVTNFPHGAALRSSISHVLPRTESRPGLRRAFFELTHHAKGHRTFAKAGGSSYPACGCSPFSSLQAGE